jgi:hypothetical protein
MHVCERVDLAELNDLRQMRSLAGTTPSVVHVAGFGCSMLLLLAGLA